MAGKNLNYTGDQVNTILGNADASATAAADGLMSKADKDKLDKIEVQANKYTHPTGAGSTHIPAGGAAGQFLKWSAAGVATWAADNNTTYAVMAGSTPTTPGTQGLAPYPSAGGANRYLRCDGIWVVPPDTNTVYTHPTGAGNNHVPTGGAAGQILRWSATGVAAWGADVNTIYSVMTGATTAAAGSSGLTPVPVAGAANRYLRSDGTWQVPPDTNTVYTHPTGAGNNHIPAGGAAGQFLKWSAAGVAVWAADNNTTYGVATMAVDGLMSKADKAKVDKTKPITISTADPSGGADGDVWIKYS